MKQFLEGDLLARMMKNASASLFQEKETINELNVFPVPDGDTGTNMSLTIASAAKELIEKNPSSIGEVTSVVANAMLRGARGNSGVILSLLFRGFSKSLKDADTVDGLQFATALSKGVTSAYKAVMKPAEGTILTVSRVMATRAEEAANEDNNAEFVIEEAIKAGEVALAETTEQNPVLKKAGVVDAGGMGYLIIVKAMLNEIRGIKAPEVEEIETKSESSAMASIAPEDITFGYCTEFICSRDTDKDPDALRFFLKDIGDSIVMVEDDEIIKVHVHTNHPGNVLEEALTYGALQTIKIENMREQHSEILEKSASQVTEAEPEKRYGFVAVCAGDGVANVFSELGADQIIEGGQTMNPSTDDILTKINQTPAEIVYVLPNNKNIIMAAEQCVKLVENKTVIVIPSKTVPQGISAMLNMDFEGEEHTNTAAMQDALSNVATMEVTYAARNSSFDGAEISEGDYLALVDNQLFATNEKMEVLLDGLAEECKKKNAEFVTIFYGEDVNLEEAQQVETQFAEACPDAEITLVRGGQPVYAYVISVE